MRVLLCFTTLLACVVTSKTAHINITNVVAKQTDLLVNTTITNDSSTALNKTTRALTKNPDKDDLIQAKIDALEKEKEETYKKILLTIEEAIPALEKANDTEALTGIENLKTLKNQLKEIHEATDSEEDEILKNATALFGNAEYRRLNGKSGDWLENARKDELLERLTRNRDAKYNSVPRVMNRQKITNQINDWLKKQKEEKKKKRNLVMQLERCPDFGTGRNRNKKKGKERNSKRYTYPCCRKCCKKSYLGCL